MVGLEVSCLFKIEHCTLKYFGKFRGRLGMRMVCQGLIPGHCDRNVLATG